jgi:hypothetical protein
MVKRSFLPGQPLSPAIPEVRRGPSRFLQVTSDRSRGSQTPLFGCRPCRPWLRPSAHPLTRRRLAFYLHLQQPRRSTGYVCRPITAPVLGLPDPPLSHLAQYPRPEFFCGEQCAGAPLTSFQSSAGRRTEGVDRPVRLAIPSVIQAAGWKLAWTWAATNSTCSGESACRVTWRAGRRALAARTGMPLTNSSRSHGSRARCMHSTG